MKRNSSGSSAILQKAKLRLLKIAGVVFCALVFNTAQAQTYTSAQTINVTADGRYQFLVKGGAGSGKLNGDVNDPNAVSANGNWGGTGATITANFYLLAGDIVYVIPGAAAQYDHAPVGGGGGGSAVIVNRLGNFHLLVVAGGGGGGGYTEMGLGGSITNYNGIQTAAGGTGNIAGGGGGGGVGAGFGGGTGNIANGGSPGIITNHVAASSGSATNGSNGASGFGGGGGGGVANRNPSTPGGGGGGGGYIGGNGAAPSASATGGTSYVNNTEAGFSALYMSAVAGVAGGNSAYSGNAGFVTVTLLPPPPTITSFSPLQAKPGDAVTISGTNFNTTLANNIVFFGATKATVTAANTTSLTVTVPVGATNSVISVLNTGTNLSAFSQKAFLPIFTAVNSILASTDFASKVDFTSGTNPGYVTMGDLDGDGKSDMVATNEADNTVSVFLNTGSQGSPSFATGIVLVTGQSPQGVAIGDIDGDGKPDIAVTAFNGNLVSIFRNTSTAGNISFAAKADIALGSCPFFVVIRDMDGDGRADLVTANKDANTVSIVLNTGGVGNISFAARVDLAAGTKPYFVTVGDLDGDGKPDVAAAAYGDNKMVVFRNKSTIGLVSFEARQDFAVTTPYSISIGDLDGDGKSDLVTGNLSTNNISVFRNTSVVGTISFATKIEKAIGQRIYNVAIGDMDGDGKNELVTSNYTNNTVSILRNTGSSGSISFATQVDLPTGAGPNYVSIADMDGDDKPDLLVSNYDDNNVSVIRNNPISFNVSGTLSAVNTIYGAASATPTSFTVSGTNLKAGITITPPTGYELSQTAGGASGYAGSGTDIVVGAAGTIVSTTVYVRLAANLIAGAYSGNVVCSSTSAATVNLATATSTVSPAALTITASNANRVYGTILTGATGATTFTSSGLQNSETIGSVTVAYTSGAGNGNTSTDAVGTYTAKVIPSAATGGTFTAANYTITYAGGDIVVGKAPLTLTANNASKTYGTILTGGTGSTAFTATGLLNSETVGSITVAYSAGAGNGNNAGDAVGTYTGKVIPSAAIGGTFATSNYTITYAPGDIVAGKAPLTITANNGSKTYGTVLTGTAGSTAFTATGLLNSETVGSVTVAYTAGAGNGNTSTDAVGTYTAKVIPSAATGGTFTATNYSITYVPADILVGQAALRITANPQSKIFGASNPALTYTVAGLVGSDALLGALTRAIGEDIGDYAITIGTLSAGANYSINFTPAVLKVSTKAITVISDAKSKALGAIDPVLTYTVTGLVGSDVLTGSLTRATGDSNGEYAITLGTLSAGTNYTINYTPAVFKINGNTLTITATATSKVYGATDPTLTYTVTGLVGNDALTGSLMRTVGEQVGTYIINLGSLSAGANYSINYVSANMDIAKAILTVSADSKQTCEGVDLPIFTMTYSGFKFNDDANNLSTKPTVTTTAKANSPIGIYALSPSGGVSANYDFRYVNANLTIAAKPTAVITSSKGNSVSKGETLALTATGGTTYSWSNANGIISGQNTATLTARPTVTTTYFVTVGNATGCSATASYTIEVREDFQAIKASNILTPNGDGINDLWIVENIDLYPNNVVTIFSQANRILFTQKSYKNTWDGKVNGLPLAEGTYYYVIDFGTNKLKQKGFITVIKQQ